MSVQEIEKYAVLPQPEFIQLNKKPSQDITLLRRKIDSLEKIKRTYLELGFIRDLAGYRRQVEEVKRDFNNLMLEYEYPLGYDYKATLIKNIEQILKNGGAWYNPYLSFKTPDIYIHHNGSRYNFGPYIIYLSNRTPLPLAVGTHYERNYNRFTHPHISSSGSLCLGDYRLSFYKLYYSGRWCDLLDLTVDFLSQYNPASPYCTIDNWFKELAYCDKCGERTVNCKCVTEVKIVAPIVMDQPNTIAVVVEIPEITVGEQETPAIEIPEEPTPGEVLQDRETTEHTETFDETLRRALENFNNF